MTDQPDQHITCANCGRDIRDDELNDVHINDVGPLCPDCQPRPVDTPG